MLELINAIFFPLMWGPAIYEIANDWIKDANRKTDVVVRGLMMISVAAAYALVHFAVRDVSIFWYGLRGLAMTIACFVFIFDYAMAARFAPDRDFLSHTAPDKKFDQYVAKIHPLWRLAIRFLIMTLASVWYW